MAIRIFCNACFCEPRKATPRFIFTSCGHVICEICFQKGKKDECLICRTPCRTVFLSKETSPEIQSLFMGIDTLCKKYSKEITQISEFQEKNRKHLLAYHREKRVKLEESLRKARQQLHQIQCMKTPQQATQMPFASTSRNPLSVPSRRPNGYSSYSLQPSHPSTSEIMEPMEVDPAPSSMRKPEAIAGPVRLSVITPPQDGRMGSVSYRSSQSSGITSSQSTSVSTRSTPIGLPHSGGCSLISPSGSQSSRRGSWSASDFRTPPLYQFTLPSPQSSVTRPPITISGILHRQHLGSANFGGQTAGR
ncbi:probable E3 SUMO-protein ligase RNF212 [Cyrtonyx montezumae]|uniref:probable E3 SUMO-protein ligase RNF212 n=1 Tax=Cyrtonyx montezumae TaxID=9017 RepID=UPI0032D9F62C